MRVQGIRNLGPTVWGIAIVLVVLAAALDLDGGWYDLPELLGRPLDRHVLRPTPHLLPPLVLIFDCHDMSG